MPTRCCEKQAATISESIPADKRYDLVVDGLFGIGLTREISGAYRNLIEEVIALKVPVLALDIPSGLDSDTGMVKGIALPAQHTVGVHRAETRPADARWPRLLR